MTSNVTIDLGVARVDPVSPIAGQRYAKKSRFQTRAPGYQDRVHRSNRYVSDEFAPVTLCGSPCSERD